MFLTRVPGVSSSVLYQRRIGKESLAGQVRCTLRCAIALSDLPWRASGPMIIEERRGFHGGSGGIRCCEGRHRQLAIFCALQDSVWRSAPLALASTRCGDGRTAVLSL